MRRRRLQYYVPLPILRPHTTTQPQALERVDLRENSLVSYGVVIYACTALHKTYPWMDGWIDWHTGMYYFISVTYDNSGSTLWTSRLVHGLAFFFTSISHFPVRIVDDITSMDCRDLLFPRWPDWPNDLLDLLTIFIL